MLEQDFQIKSDGTIIRDEITSNSDEDMLMQEYTLLAYEVHHARHPTQDPEKIARYEELKRILKIDEEKQGNAFSKAKAKILSNMKPKDNSLLKLAIANQKNKN